MTDFARVSWPTQMMATQLVYCGRLGRDELSTATVSMTLFLMMWMAITGAGGTMDTLGSQAYGAGDARAVKSWAMLTTAVIVACCVPMNIVLSAAKEIAQGVFNLDSAQAADVRACCLVLSIGLWPLALTLGVQKYLAVQRRVMAIGVTSLLTLVANIAFHEAFMNVAHKGVLGSQWAMTVARVANLLFLLAYCAYIENWHRKGTFQEYYEAGKAITRDMFYRAVRLSFSGVLMVFGEAFAFEMTVVMASQLGEVELNAHMIMLNIATFSFMCGPMALGTAASIRVGNLLGARDECRAKRAAWLIVAMSVTWMGCCATTIITSNRSIAKLYTNDDSDVISLVSKIAPFCAMFQLCDGLLGACNGVLRACGKQFLIAWTCLLSLWVVGLSSAALFAFVGDYGVRGIWWGLAMGVCSAGTSLAFHCTRLDWRHEAYVAKRSATNIGRDYDDDYADDFEPKRDDAASTLEQ